MAKNIAKPAPATSDIDRRFAALLRTLGADRAIAGAVDAFWAQRVAGGPRRFGSGALKVDGKIFAMFVRGQLVVKLPKDRVAALVAAGSAEHFTANKGVAMKEWAALTCPPAKWPALAREAHAFVGGGAR